MEGRRRYLVNYMIMDGFNIYLHFRFAEQINLKSYHTEPLPSGFYEALACILIGIMVSVYLFKVSPNEFFDCSDVLRKDSRRLLLKSNCI